jgi:hypothetical protein
VADNVIYVVQVCSDRAGVRALARAATSASTEEFTSADALWRFLVGMQEPIANEESEATAKQRTSP